MKMLVLVLLLLCSFPGVNGVGQIGGDSGNLGRKNGAISANTLRARAGFMKKFGKFLTLKDLDEEKFFLQDNIKQCGILKLFWECLRKEKSYKKMEHRVC